MRKTTIILSVLVALLGTGIWLAGREPTLLWLADRGCAALDGKLKVEGLRGSLLRKIYAQRIEFQDGDTKLTATGATLHLRPVALLAGTLSVPHIAIDTAEVSLPPPTSEPPVPPKPPESIGLPLRLSLDEVTVRRLDIQRGTTRFPLSDVALGLTGAKAWQLQLRSLATPWGNARGKARIADPSPFPMTGHFVFSADGEHAYSASATVSGTLLRLKIAAGGEAHGGQARAEAVLTPFAANVLERLSVQADGINPRAWQAAAPQAELRLRANAQADTETAIRGDAIVENATPGTLDRDQLPLVALRGTFAGDAHALALSDIVLDLGEGGRLVGAGDVKDAVMDLKLSTDALNLRGLQGTLRATKLRSPMSPEPASVSRRSR